MTFEQGSKTRKTTLLIPGIFLALAGIFFLVKFIYPEALYFFKNDVQVIVEAALKGDSAKIKSMSDEGVDFDDVDSNGDNALTLLSSASTRPDVFELVVQNTKSKEHRNNQDKSALEISIETANLKHVKTLVEHGAEYNGKDNRKWTPLMHAIACDLKVCEDIALYLAENGADVTKKNNKDKYAFDLARERLDGKNSLSSNLYNLLYPFDKLEQIKYLSTATVSSLLLLNKANLKRCQTVQGGLGAFLLGLSGSYQCITTTNFSLSEQDLTYTYDLVGPIKRNFESGSIKNIESDYYGWVSGALVTYSHNKSKNLIRAEKGVIYLKIGTEDIYKKGRYDNYSKSTSYDINIRFSLEDKESLVSMRKLLLAENLWETVVAIDKNME